MTDPRRRIEEEDARTENSGEHDPTHARCSTFWCVKRMEMDQDGEPETFGEELARTGF